MIEVKILSITGLYPTPISQFGHTVDLATKARKEEVIWTKSKKTADFFSGRLPQVSSQIFNKTVGVKNKSFSLVESHFKPFKHVANHSKLCELRIFSRNFLPKKLRSRNFF